MSDSGKFGGAADINRRAQESVNRTYQADQWLDESTPVKDVLRSMASAGFRDFGASIVAYRLQKKLLNEEAERTERMLKKQRALVAQSRSTAHATWFVAGFTGLLAAATVALVLFAGKRGASETRFTPAIRRETVYRVIDGDTLQLSSREKIRISTIDAPEMSGADGKASRQALLKLVQGQVLTVEREGFDPYGRTLARLYLADGREVGAVMIEKKMATPWPGW